MTNSNIDAELALKSALEAYGNTASTFYEKTATNSVVSRVLVDYLVVKILQKNSDDFLSADERILHFYNAIKNYFFDDFQLEKLDYGFHSFSYSKTLRLTSKEREYSILIKYNLNSLDMELDLSGDACQALRANDSFFEFLKFLESEFSPVFKRVDISLDVFNSPITPDYFYRLYEKGRFKGKSKMTVVGGPGNLTVYLGRPHKHRTLMIYDKLQEGADKGVYDEPELAANVSSWLRLEHLIRSENGDADKLVKEFLAVSEDEFEDRLNGIHRELTAKKGEFLTKPVDKFEKDEPLVRDRYWAKLIKGRYPLVKFHNHKVKYKSLLERRKNFFKGHGGARFLLEYMDAFGKDSVFRLLELYEREYLNDLRKDGQ